MREIAVKVAKAEDFDSRSRGLLGRDAMEPGEGLWILPCPMIHTFFMRFPIDVVFLDRQLKAVRVIENLKPWRLSPWVFRARSVLELPGGSLKGSVQAGDRLEIR
ncbi:MAG: DUF192 domain-containing protein [Elusimicrobia bacterium]|nr:DUF192 domain-containing protein [Elusimicrobiota bacterium]